MILSYETILPNIFERGNENIKFMPIESMYFQWVLFLLRKGNFSFQGKLPTSDLNTLFHCSYVV